MKELPSHLVSEDFYIWFNINEKEEYYSTPLYLYNVLRKDTDKENDEEKKRDETRVYLKLEKDISKTKLNRKKEIIKHPSTIYIHYAESIGMLLINFLNADFSSFASAYNTFFYAYGFELIKEYVPYIYSKNDEFITDIEFMDMLEDIYNTSLDDLLEWQENFRKCVDFVYNLNGNEEYKEQSIYSKFVAYTIKNDIYTYSQDVEVILDNYINIHNRHHNESIEHLMKGIEDKEPNLELHNVYTSTKLKSICFTILDQLVRQENLPIKTCQICGRYFIPTFRQNEIYCDLPNVDGSATCREKGATINYKKNLESVPALGLYRKMYQQKVMVVYRNKEDKKIKKDFDKWKKEAQNRVNKMKHGLLTEDEVYEWLLNSK